jgi:hypothetical protein
VLRPTPEDVGKFDNKARLYVRVRLANALVFGLTFAMLASSFLVPTVEAGPEQSHWPSGKRSLTIVDRTGDQEWHDATQWAVARWNEAETGYRLIWTARPGPCRHEGTRISVCLAPLEEVGRLGHFPLQGRVDEKVDGNHKRSARILVCSDCTSSQDRRRVVMTHEVGHALGLGHTRRRDSVMYHGGGSAYPDDTDARLLRNSVAHRDSRGCGLFGWLRIGGFCL